ncbi:hypothetical protein HK104_011080 [Borealophlyctis nickersoniae]|nr:hypothetical protein HK104_011080 [Borealophlyctis nickersoniae]
MSVRDAYIPLDSGELVEQANDITQEMLPSGEWKTAPFKKYNFNAEGLQPTSGALHPLMSVREEYRQIFLELGFSEMPTSKYVESAFWNFDALFQPQQHPARDAHDTFFLSEPATSDRLPMDYVERVKKVHSVGGYGSWAEKLTLRTHTTAVSSYMLYQLAQQKEFKPVKWFSIDKVFRNETLDAIHLAEFHQIEGVVADRGLTLGDLIGVLHGFFQKLGLKKLRFKPAYNPYTEPSMEIFALQEGSRKWVEVGNSGMFRPEMLLPLGLPTDVSVIAWRLPIDRHWIIKYGIDNMRDLVGHTCDLTTINLFPSCRGTCSMEPNLFPHKPDAQPTAQIPQISPAADNVGWEWNDGWDDPPTKEEHTPDIGDILPRNLVLEDSYNTVVELYAKEKETNLDLTSKHEECETERRGLVEQSVGMKVEISELREEVAELRSLVAEQKVQLEGNEEKLADLSERLSQATANTHKIALRDLITRVRAKLETNFPRQTTISFNDYLQTLSTGQLNQVGLTRDDCIPLKTGRASMTRAGSSVVHDMSLPTIAQAVMAQRGKTRTRLYALFRAIAEGNDPDAFWEEGEWDWVE